MRATVSCPYCCTRCKYYSRPVELGPLTINAPFYELHFVQKVAPRHSVLHLFNSVFPPVHFAKFGDARGTYRLIEYNLIDIELLVIALPVGEHQFGDMVDSRVANLGNTAVFVDLVVYMTVRAWTGRLDPIAQYIVECNKPTVRMSDLV